MNSGLYKELTEQSLLIKHDEVNFELDNDPSYKIIKPQLIKFISYPYEWCFSQLKNAALHTLKVQLKALEFGMTLKDCSGYNIQFKESMPIFIDTLSFEKYIEGDPWIAYRQYCQHFLAPLALMAKKDINMNQLLKIFIDGIPLDIASKLLGKRTRFNFHLLTHLHLHAKTQKKYSTKKINKSKVQFSKLAFKGLLDSLYNSINNLNYDIKKTIWSNYYNESNYSNNAMSAKEGLVSKYIDKTKSKIIWDLGSNTGRFSQISNNKNIFTVSMDNDPLAVEKNYLRTLKESEAKILPLMIDLTNPSSSIGWAHNERMSLEQRGPADTVLALALIHHLAIANNLPFLNVAGYFYKICKFLIIEFVPKSDSQVQKLLTNREDIFAFYEIDNFEQDFKNYFKIIHKSNVPESNRTLFLMEKNIV